MSPTKTCTPPMWSAALRRNTMSKQQRLLLFILFLIIISAPVAFFILLDGPRRRRTCWPVGCHRSWTTVYGKHPIFDVRDFGYQPFVLPGASDTTNATVIEQGGERPQQSLCRYPQNRFHLFHPGATAHYEITSGQLRKRYPYLPADGHITAAVGLRPRFGFDLTYDPARAP